MRIKTNKNHTLHFSLRGYLLISLGFLVPCMILIVMYTTLSYSHLQETTLSDNLLQLSEQASQSVENTYSLVEDIASSIAYNQIVQQYLLMDPDSKKDQQYDYYNTLSSLLTNFSLLNPTILDIALVSDNGTGVNISGVMNDYYKLYETCKDTNDEFIYLGRSTTIIESRSYVSQIIAMPVYNLATMDKIGMEFISLNPSVILSNIHSDSTGIGVQYLLVDSNGELLSGDEKIYAGLSDLDNTESTFPLTMNDITYKCHKYISKDKQVTLYSIANTNDYTKQIRQIAYRQMLTLGGFCMFIIIAITFLFRPVIRSLKRLAMLMHRISTRKRKALYERICIDKDITFCTDINSIAVEFNNMLDEIQTLNHTIFNTYSQMHELEVVNKETEIAYLRSQINPHFLYNTLTLICGMSSVGETQGVIDVTSALSMIFRYSIKGEALVTVQEEVEITESYVMIQSKRFEDRFTVSYNISDDTLSAIIPKMIMQPLVENAISHGLEKSLKKGRLEIGCLHNSEDNTLLIWIYDTGVGMSSEQLQHLKNDLKLKSSHNDSVPSDSIGLRNVNERIRLYYGDAYGLKIDSVESEWTRIQICIPYTTEYQK